MLKHQVKVAQALLSAMAEGGRGTSGTAFPKQPEKALKLYEFEGSPFCRRVREVLTTLNLDYEDYPCPKGGTLYRKDVKALGGKMRFPFFVDENTGDQMYESQQIIHHLFKHYGRSGSTPSKYANFPRWPVAAFAGTLLNGARGVWINPKVQGRKTPEHLLELWGFEASPFTRIVRAELSELELAFKFHNVAKERWQDQGLAVLRLKPGKYVPLAGGKREQVFALMGDRLQVPFLYDPNTGVKMFESAAIVDYLRLHYS